MKDEMRLKFVKMSGAGNDFIVFNNMDSSLDGILTEQFIRYLCSRGISVGADGVLELKSDSEYPFLMKYYNSNGKVAEMCGNGGRCVVEFAVHSGLVPDGKAFSFRSDAGIHYAKRTGQDAVRLWMTDPKVHFLDRKFDLNSISLHVSFLNTGVPHAVVFMDEAESISFSDFAPELRRHEMFWKEGANVNFVWRKGKSELSIRTWERGVEGETLACGTGAVASAICAVDSFGFDPPVNIEVRSGKVLKVGKSDRGWWLQGEARIVYSGLIENIANEALTVVS